MRSMDRLQSVELSDEKFGPMLIRYETLSCIRYIIAEMVIRSIVVDRGANVNVERTKVLFRTIKEWARLVLCVLCDSLPFHIYMMILGLSASHF
jgi:hypothetical protein